MIRALIIAIALSGAASTDSVDSLGRLARLQRDVSPMKIPPWGKSWILSLQRYHINIAASVWDDALLRERTRQYQGGESDVVKATANGVGRSVLSTPRQMHFNEMLRKIVKLPHGSNSVRILCVTYTHKQGHLMAVQQHRSWGYQCDRHMIFTNADIDGGRDVIRDYDKNVVVFTPDGGEQYNNMWQKTRGIMHRIREAMQDHDFLLMNGDDTFVIVDSLRAYLGDILGIHRALGVPIFSGYLQRSSFTHGRFISGAGYLLDHLAYDQYINIAYDICHTHDVTFSEDVVMATCMHGIGVEPRNAQDVYGGDMMHPLPPHTMAAMPGRPHAVWWYRDFRLYPMPQGYEAVSPLSSLFHFVRNPVIISALEATAGKSGVDWWAWMQ